MNEALIQRIHQCPTLPSLPAVALEVLQIAQSDTADISEIAQIVSKDPALSCKILRTVNSSFYGRSQSVCNLHHALTILGLQSVRTLVLGFSLVSNLKTRKSQGFNHLRYWRRSLFAATAARAIAARTSLVQQEECFLAGLMMDLGMLVLDQLLGEQYSRIYEQSPHHCDLLLREREILDLTHADAVGILANQWKLPPLLTQPMRCHHEPELLQLQDPTLYNMAYILQIACHCADVFMDEQAAEPIVQVRRLCREFPNMKEEDVDVMLAEIGQQTKEVAPLFEITMGGAGDYESILRKANETLVELTLQTQQQVHSLSQQNQQLQIAATRDKLTGLPNRAVFDERLAEMVRAARDQARPLSLLMMDIDRFKSINDTFGHQAGDHILTTVGKILASAARASDLAARYGGEEMVLLLPETGRTTAAAVAESIRRMIAAHAIRYGRRNIKVSASFGVATLEPGGPLSAPPHLLKAADLALYAAKNGGRNCVRVFSLKSAA